MMHERFLNFIWWLSTPFFVVFFFLVLLLFTGGVNYIESFLYLTLFLVTIPLFIDWSIAMFYTQDAEIRAKISAAVFFLSALFTYIFLVDKFANFIKNFYIVFFLEVIFSFVIRLFKQNQYTFLLGAFLAVTASISIYFMIDLFYLFIVEFIFSGILMSLFLKHNIDSLKNMLIFYFSGFLSTAILNFLLFVFLPF